MADQCAGRIRKRGVIGIVEGAWDGCPPPPVGLLGIPPGTPVPVPLVRSAPMMAASGWRSGHGAADKTPTRTINSAVRRFI